MTTMKKLSSKILCLLLALSCACLVPMSAFADLQAGAVSFQANKGFSGNSWRYENGSLKEDFCGTDSGVQLFGLSTQATEFTSSDPSMTHLGIDVSYAQGSINWSAVAKTKVKFAIIQCGYGSDYASQDDVQWINNVRGCIQNHIPFGVYLYSYAENVDMAKSEALHVVHAIQRANNAIAGATVDASSIRFPIYYDVEENKQLQYSNDKLNSLFYAFRDTLNQHGYPRVGLYSNCEWYSKKWTTVNVPAEFRWVARYGKNDGTTYGTYCTGYEASMKSKGCGIWQFASVGRISGISGNVDMNFASNDIRFLNQSGSIQNVYRLYNPSSSEHLFTRDSNECGVLEGRGWIYEGVGWTSSTVSGAPVYRLYNPRNGDHHYTLDRHEYDMVPWLWGWVQEGIAWYDYGQDSGQVPVYRLYNPNAWTGVHHFTTDEHEYNTIPERWGWVQEGIAWYG